MTQLEALQKKFINLRFGTFIHFNSATFQFHNNPDIIDWEYDHENGDLPRQFPFDEKDFNPTAPDYCKQWAKIAKSAGCQFAALNKQAPRGLRSLALRLYRSLCEKCDKQNRCRCRLSGRVPQRGNRCRSVFFRARPDCPNRSQILHCSAERKDFRSGNRASYKLWRNPIPDRRRLECSLGWSLL